MSASATYSLSGSAAERYERNMVGAIFAPFAGGLLEHAALREGEQVLDAACGTGIVARLAWPQVAPTGRVHGLDVNRAMLEVARGVEGAERIEWREADAATMPFEEDSFDVALCHHGLQYFRDRRAALAEMRRVLRPSGRLALSVWRPVAFNPGHAVFADVLERRVGAQAAATRRAPFKLCDRVEIRTLVAEAGYRDITVRLDARVARFPSAEAMIRIMMEGTPLGTAMGEADPSVLQSVITETTQGLSEYEDDQGLALPMQAWVVTAKA
jgi:ubiquinone/menaquinone biosynthesis C-methylase UbiE